MTKREKSLLIQQASTLMFTGYRVDRARRKVRLLRERGLVPADPRMREAVKRFLRLTNSWRALERSHLALRESLAATSDTNLN